MRVKAIRILQIEDDASDSRLLQMMLEQVAPGQFEIVGTPLLGEGLKLLNRGGFDLVLSDLDLPDSRGLDTYLQIAAQSQGVPVVVLTGLADEEVAIQAVQKGAQDYLIKGETNGTLVVRAMRHALERHKKQREQLNYPAPKKGKVLAFLGAKGGVGTTTVALNVATALARKKNRVILVELRPYLGTLAPHLRRSPPDLNLRQLLDLGPGRLNAAEVLAHLSETECGLRVLYGPQTSAEFGELDPGYAARLIEELEGLADYVVLDLPSMPSAASEAAARKCGYVTVLVERDAACVAAGQVLLAVLRGWGVGDRRVGAVLVNREAVCSPMKLADTRAALGCDVVGVLPPAPDPCVSARQAATPLVLFQPQHLASLALEEMAGVLSTELATQARLL